MTDPVRFTDAVYVRTQEGTTAFIQAKAREAGTKPSEIARQALMAGLKSIGLTANTYKGAEYDNPDLHGGKSRFAWVEGDQIKDVSWNLARPEHEGRTYLPVVHLDSEPFDPALHWRLNPVFSIEGDHVRCTYPVVAKSQELA